MADDKSFPDVRRDLRQLVEVENENLPPERLRKAKKYRQAQMITDMSKQFILDLIKAHEAGLVTLPEDLRRRLFLLPYNNWLTDNLPAGRPNDYTDEEKIDFVNRTHELRNTGRTIDKALQMAASELFDKHRRPNSGRYSKWMEAFELPYPKSKPAKKSAPKANKVK